MSIFLDKYGTYKKHIYKVINLYDLAAHGCQHILLFTWNSQERRDMKNPNYEF